MDYKKGLEDKKFENYNNLRIILIKITDEILRHYRSYSAIRAILGQKISEYTELKSAFLDLAKTFPEIVKVNENGSFYLRMVSMESENEDDPIFNTFTLTTIDDIFWVKRIVNSAFLNMIDKNLN